MTHTGLDDALIPCFCSGWIIKPMPVCASFFSAAFCVFSLAKKGSVYLRPIQTPQSSSERQRSVTDPFVMTSVAALYASSAAVSFASRVLMAVESSAGSRACGEAVSKLKITMTARCGNDLPRVASRRHRSVQPPALPPSLCVRLGCIDQGRVVCTVV